eukprot:TRINITY_DN38578_c0_g1_i1.p1 TRINITY_DN38578_c0_g1~~TRINITY_DN38578_c0_g1_i1.p1  ORF type:complete len:1924 (+),score=258.06 TRINITY_DN38578_c0_g1_i1:805-5772(+)
MNVLKEKMLPLPSGGLVDFQSLVYAWIYNYTRAYKMPNATDLPRCMCMSNDTETPALTEDLSRCNPQLTLLQMLTPYWSSMNSEVLKKHGMTGCLGRLSSLFPVSVREIPFPTPSFTDDPFAVYVGPVIGLFFTLIYLWPLTRIIKSFTDDKESRINEVMKMMGMPGDGIIFGWYFAYGLLWIVPSLLITLACWSNVFQHSNKFIVFLFFWLFGICVLTFCSLLAVFFERSKTASVVGALVFFILYFPYVFVAQEGKFASQLATICPPVALSFGAKIIVDLESAGVGIQWGNITDEVTNLSLFSVLIMLVFDTILFAVLAFYLDRVLVVGFGTRQPWYFPCLRRTWKVVNTELSQERLREIEESFDDMHPGHPRYEPVSEATASTRSVMLRGLTKRFTTQSGDVLTAVQELTANLYSGQIFILLGHNGAGKSTTINMLSGLLPVDGGDALMYGRSVVHDMQSIRRILGVCPQHDVIWLEMSVQEHLLFFARVKGVLEETVAQEVNQMVLDVGLEEKRDALSGTLSGGQKRRLSAAIALIGGSQVVFLDEPSSGVDPFSRRELWVCLRQKKVGRTLIMTTHFMDEAEELADRIAIMAAGQIKCLGTSLFLKSVYGVGYTLTITKTRSASHPASSEIATLRAFIESTCPSAVMLSDVGVEIVYRIPLDQSRFLGDLAQRFEQAPSDYGIDFFSISVTTLEEVFLRAGQDHTEADLSLEDQLTRRSFVREISETLSQTREEPRQQAVVSAGAPPSSRGGRVNVSATVPLREAETIFETSDLPATMRGATFQGHVYALLSKRYSNAKRDKKAWCCQVGVPILFLLVALCTLKFSGIGIYPAVSMALDELPGEQEVVYGGGVGVDNADMRRLFAGLGNTGSLASGSMSPQQFSNYLASGYNRSSGKARYGAFRVQRIPQWNSTDDFVAQDCWVASNYKEPGHVRTSKGECSKYFPTGLTVPVGTLWNESVVLPELLQSVTVPMSSLNNRLQVDMFWNSTARDAVPIFFHQLHNSNLRAVLGPQKLGNSLVKVYNQAFPLTASMKQLSDGQTGLFLALGFAFVPASFGAFVVLERETKSKHLQVISGVNFISYWIATWIWDMINSLVPTGLSLALIAAFGVDSLTGGTNFLWTALALIGFSFNCTSFTYMLTFLFESHTSAGNILLIVYLFSGGFLQIVFMVLSIVPSTQVLARQTLVYFFRLLPNFTLANALTNMIGRDNILVSTMLCGKQACDALDLHVMGWDLIYMFGLSFVWFGVTLFLEVAVATPKLRAALQFRNVDIAEEEYTDEDPDVRAERERLESGAADGDVVVLKGLRKVFPGRKGVPPKAAVRSMSFSIPEGQCFGYLGMNGAGKTTTMKILTGEELCTRGGAWLGGFDIKTQQGEVRRLLGYCPQFDALIGTLTAREHLMLFARIKGFPSDRINAYVEELLDKLTLTPYADRQAHTFSGGTRRKLSLGIALVGDPRIVFLDEPTTGVDPESRRFMWKLISTTMCGRSVILTTHSMDECEALCARIGIMVNGSLVCLGSASHLKTVHGSGYQVDVSFQAAAQAINAFESFNNFVNKMFPEGGTSVLEWAPTSMRLKMRIPKGKYPISAIFREIEGNRDDLSVQEYSVAETTLDQIFINFARHQKDERTGMALADSVHSLHSDGEARDGSV